MPALAGYDPRPSDHVGVEVSFTATPDGTPTWTNVTPYLDLGAGLSITRGRTDEYSTTQPGMCSLTLDNHDARFTAGNASSPYYPNVLPYRKIRVFYTDPNTGVRTYRFTGYVEEWPVEWPNGGAYSQATISATDRMARLGARLPLQSVIEQVMYSQNPVVYYRLGEESGATAAADSIGTYASPMTIKQYGTGGTLEFGTATGPPTDGLPAPTFTRVDGNNGKGLYAPFPNRLRTTNGAITVRCSFLTSTAVQQMLVQLDTEYVTGELWLYVNASGKLAVDGGGFTYLGSSSTANQLSLASTVTVTDGLTHDAVVVLTGTSASLYCDGALVASDTYDERVLRDVITGIRLGAAEKSPSRYLLNGVISHAAVFNGTLTAAQVLEQYQATSTGFSGDLSGQRIARLAAWAGLSTTETALDAGASQPICFVDTTGTAAIAAMQDVAETTENGRLFMSRDGLLTFRSRDTVTNNPRAKVTVDASLLGPDAQFVMSTQGMVNDITGKRPTGPEVRVYDQDSINTYGPLTQSLVLLLTNDTDVTDALNWRLSGHSQPEVRMPRATLDLYTDTTGIQAQLRALDLGDHLTITGLPSQAPTPTVDLVVEGYSETIGLTGWTLSANTSNLGAVETLLLDDFVFGTLDAGNRLAY